MWHDPILPRVNTSLGLSTPCVSELYDIWCTTCHCFVKSSNYTCHHFLKSFNATCHHLVYSFDAMCWHIIKFHDATCQCFIGFFFMSRIIIWLHQLMTCARISSLSYGVFLYQSHLVPFFTNFGYMDNILSYYYWIFFSFLVLLIWLIWTCHVFYTNLGPKALHIT
jgi:hypothetical protein